jgi:hypothetical protein
MAWSGSALVIAGVISLAFGRSEVEESEAVDVGDPALEERYDRGRLMYATGAGAALIGIVLLTSEIVDGLAARDLVERTEERTDVVATGTVACGREPAAGVVVVVTGNGGEVRATTNSGGTVVLDLAAGLGAMLAFQEPFGQLSCENCKPVYFTLTPEASAERIIRQGDWGQLERWLQVHPTHPAKAKLLTQRAAARAAAIDIALQKARARLADGDPIGASAAVADCRRNGGAENDQGVIACEAVAKEIALLEAATALKDAWAAKKIGDDSRARVSLTHCLEVAPNDVNCLGQLKGLDFREARLALAEAKKLLRSKDFEAATQQIENCVALGDPGGKCAALQRDMRSTAEKERAKAEARETSDLREAIGDSMERRFLENGFSATIRTGGRYNTLISIYIPGITKAEVYGLFDKGGIAETLRSHGFKRLIIYRRGYRESGPRDYWDYKL